MEPTKLVKYLGHEYDPTNTEKFALIYKTADDYGRIRTTRFAFQYFSQTKMVGLLYTIEDVLLPIGLAESIEEAVTVARTYLERTFTDLKFAIEEDKKFIHLWEEKRKKKRR